MTITHLILSEAFGADGEPISLAAAKEHLRVTSDDEDELIASLITAAREHVENYTGRVLAQREFTEHRVDFGSYLELYRRPVTGDIEIAYTDSDGEAATVSSFSSMADAYPARVYPAFGESWPSIRSNTLISVRYVAGYADGEVPTPLKQAMLLLIAAWYENRSVVSERPMSEVSFAVTALADPYRAPGL